MILISFLVNKVLWEGYGKPLIYSVIKMHNGNRNEKHVTPEFIMPRTQEFFKSVHWFVPKLQDKKKKEVQSVARFFYDFQGIS